MQIRAVGVGVPLAMFLAFINDIRWIFPFTPNEGGRKKNRLHSERSEVAWYAVILRLVCSRNFMLGESFSLGKVYEIDLLPGGGKRPCKLYVGLVKNLG